MAEKYITEQQVRLYMKNRENRKVTQAGCAAKAGLSVRSAYTIEQGLNHTQAPKKLRNYKIRKSPIDEIWETELVPMLQAEPKLQPKTLLIYLQHTYFDEMGAPLYDGSVLRTLQRRVAQGLAHHGKPKAIVFPQRIGFTKSQNVKQS
jgi:DNA-binding XRE family transcriptional regulator